MRWLTGSHRFSFVFAGLKRSAAVNTLRMIMHGTSFFARWQHRCGASFFRQMAATCISSSNMASRRRKNTELLQREIENCWRLVESATEGLVEDVRSILKSSVSVDADEYNRSLFYKSKNYMTPLLCAASRGNSECVRELIAWGGAY